ncbi:MAG: alcohol dehydrogenase catalytic domain-containing protein [Spirochaetia bacterium]|jgi:L-iditol 2-dehydrogenase|nr:alcohol dehydrogenase catalytic domain-containing protein [Spirochaetia bacterium]MCE1209059.1 alcohol dehydrogenase catalytic domain-containing protein [Spirochaetia bacterium]MDD3820215.1 alcohol dehydrogenase catalytic domain-containing protein [Spirochaetales bacterium]VBB39623.1 Alcohol dehydrogenase superfamily, zinc-containing [uncultured Spirochaetota bacterium]HOI22873.1 alcohol dehydrogenase catalytic domain-containing protein [Spirochaetales bacterium]
MSHPTMMRAAVLHDWNDIRIEQRPVPAPGPGEVLIKIESCSICGGDVKIVTRGMIKQPPMGTFIIGHEYAGTIVELGEAVDEFVLGDRVTVEVHKGCGRCRNCIDGKYTACLNYGNLAKGHRANGFTTNGGFAEYAVNHVNTISKIPDNISFDEATIITTAGTALFGIEHTGGFVAGDSVAVVGPGAIGLMAVQCAKALGAGKVILTGTRDERLNLGKKLGADVVINLNKEDPIAAVKRETGGYGADLVLLTAGNSASLQQAIRVVRKGGDIVLVAHFEDTVSADLGICVQNSNNLYTVRGEGKRCVHRALELMRMGKIQAKDLLTHSYPLDQIQEAFRVFMAREGGAIRIVLHP